MNAPPFGNLVPVATVTKENPPPRMVKIGALSAHLGETVDLRGWVADIRTTKHTNFIQLRDRSGEVQLVCRAGAADLPQRPPTIESAIRVVGKVQTPQSSRFGSVELVADCIEVLAEAKGTGGRTASPFDPIRHRFLVHRKNEKAIAFEVRTTVLKSIRDYLVEQSFLEIQTPKITPSGSESGAAIFELDYFGERAFLAQSPQFYMQMAMASGLEAAFEVAPAFRAEKGVTDRHAAEFTSIDVEWSWVVSTDELMDKLEALMRHMLAAVRSMHGEQIAELLEIEIPRLDRPIWRIGYREALKRAGATKLTHDAEQTLCKIAQRETGASFVFVTHMPASTRPFYTRRKDGGTTASFDLLWRGTEICSGCIREHNAEILRRQMEEAGLDERERAQYLEPYFLEMFDYGCPPHGGFGLGLDRLLMLMLGAASLEEVCLALRAPNRLAP